MQGETGESAYEIYCKQHPEYTGSEADWLRDLTNGDLADDITITVDTNGGNLISPIKCRPNSYIDIEEPTRQGFVFNGWYLNGSLIDINTYVFRTSCTIVAHYKSATINVKLEADGGSLDYNKITVDFNSFYSLPIPTKKFQVFDGRFFANMKVSNSGTRTIKEDCTLVARWKKKEITVTLSVDYKLGNCSTKTRSLNSGDKFVLPVPTAITDAAFQGWFYGEKQVTDAKGVSFGTLDYDNNIVLNAKFYTEINNIYQILSMSNSESTTGNYRVTKDLDFQGIDMSPIENFSGIFDGGGHILSNINLVKGKGNYGGFFGTISSKATIKNIEFNCIESNGNWVNSGGLIGCLEGKETGNRIENFDEYAHRTFEIKIDNISFDDSFNKSSICNFGLFVGAYKNYISRPIYDTFGDSSREICLLTCSNLKTVDSLKNKGSYAKSYLINQCELKVDYEFTNGISQSDKQIQKLFDKKNIKIDGLYLQDNTNDSVNYENHNGILNSCIYTNTQSSTKIKSGIMATNLENNINGLKSFIAPNDVEPLTTIDVSCSSNYGSTKFAWGGVTNLENCISTNDTQSWGAKKSLNCIDAAVQGQKFSFSVLNEGIATNCVSLMPDGDGVYKYYNSASKIAEVKKASLINKDFFVSLLKFDENIWDFNDLDIINRQYPKIIK